MTEDLESEHEHSDGVISTPYGLLLLLLKQLGSLART